MQPTVRRARRTADTRGYAHRERAARWGRPRPEHPPGVVEIAGCGLIAHLSGSREYRALRQSNLTQSSFRKILWRIDSCAFRTAREARWGLDGRACLIR